MNWERIEGNWKQMTHRVKERWEKLTEEDLNAMAGKRDQLLGKIQERYGVAKDHAEQQIAQWQAKIDESWFHKKTDKA